MSVQARPERGQAAVEVALVMPVVALLLLGVVQVALVVRDQVLVVHAAREAARAAAVDASPGAARRAALAATTLDGRRMEVAASPGAAAGDRPLVTATVRYRSPTAAPLVGNLLPDVVVRGQASMRREFRRRSRHSPWSAVTRRANFRGHPVIARVLVRLTPGT